ncbi:MAG: rhodanese-like domain-containing protein [Myxococcota bacterium]
MAEQSEWDITVEELKVLRDEGGEHVLVDVRETHEVEAVDIGGKHIPLGELAQRLAELDPDAHIVVHCKVGGRSARAVEIMRASGFGNAWNLQGGILAWIDRIDPSLPKY